LAYCNIDGKIVADTDAAVTVGNGAFRYGYGLFETMLVESGAIHLFSYHWERLTAGLRQLYFEVSPLMTAAWMEDEVLKTARKNKLEKLCRVRLQLYAAGGGLYSNESRRPGFVIECFPLERETIGFNENGLIAGVATGLQKSADILGNLKSCSALIYAVAAKQAKENRWNDALICNTYGRIIESSLANIFLIKDRVVYTPPLSEGCVAGVMRRHVTEVLKNVVEQPVTMEQLCNADEVFLTNAIKRVKWVGSIGGMRLGNDMVRSINDQVFPTGTII
jgi:branched-chain amino acid aminotransferase